MEHIKYSLIVLTSPFLFGCVSQQASDGFMGGMTALSQNSEQNYQQSRQNTQSTYERYDKAMENYRNGFKQPPSYKVTDEKGRSYIVTPR